MTGATLELCQSAFNWAQPVSALAGVIIGGSISFLTTRLFDKRRLKELNQGRAYALFFKLVRLSNDLEQAQEHLKTCFGKLDQLDEQEPSWPRLLDFFGFSDAEIVFSAEELALVASMKDQQLTMDLMELEAGHRIVTSTLEQITNLRQKIADSGLAKQINGNVVTFEATQEQMAAIGPTLLNLDSFAKSLIKSVPELTTLSRSTSPRLSAKIKDHYKFKDFVHLSYPEDAAKMTNPSST